MGNERNRPFTSTVRFPVRRTEKPRECGLTWFLDWGAGISYIEGMLVAVGDHLDLAKLPALSAGLQPCKYLEEKIALYRKHDIKPFMGGMYLEAALICGKSEEFLKEARNMGFEVMEVSESESRMTPSTKISLVEMSARLDFKVMAELGPHYAEAPYEPREVIRETKKYLESGAWKVILESDVIEFMKPWSNANSAAIMKEIIDEIGYENLIFEVSDDVRSCQWFILHYGPDVNIALNKGPVAQLPEGVMTVEHIRRGLLMPETWYGRFTSL